ncbi:xylulokinase [Armatimonadetes bacterium GBS]|jgi:xylulokinase|nr:xylulokinase [Armatimonadetes bacterium GBS]CUU38661.1 xylulokinase [Armatimonadetes bacterium GXS]
MLLGIDIGTSGVKAVLIDTEGRVIASASESYPLLTPKPLWAEQNPEDWWHATCKAIRQILQDSGVAPGAIRGIGLSGQMHGSVFLDADGRVIRPALLWCDQRTADECAWITERVGEQTVLQTTLNPVLTGFQAGKIIWLRRHEPENYARVRHVLLPKDYIRFMLTGEFATEVSDASGTALFEVPKRDWAYTMLDTLELPREWFPRVYESPEITGRVNAAAAQATGLAEGTPVVGGAGDQAAGAVGGGVVEEGIASVAVGTSGVVFAHLNQPRVDAHYRTHTFCHAVPGAWHVMGVMLMAGGALQWYRDTFMPQESFDTALAEAEAVSPSSEGLLFLPYLSGERTPHADPKARGAFVGATLAHGRGHFTRAVLEGVAYGLRDSLEILREMGLSLHQLRLTGGGAKSPLWRQILADVFGQPVHTLQAEEGPAFGVALLAGVGTGVWDSVPEACAQTVRLADSTEPSPTHQPLYEAGYAQYRQLYPALKPFFRLS